MIKRILFPVDFSPSNGAMARYVKRSADMFGAQVTLVHVCDLMSHNGFELYVRPVQEVAEEHQQIAQDRLDTFLVGEFPAATCHRVLRSGEAAAEIVNLAKADGFDLIVMPTHGGRFRRMLIGSTTAKILDEADCPVLTTEHSEVQVPRPLHHRVWVCGLSLSPDSERVLRVASHAAEQVGAKLCLVHVVENRAEHLDSDEKIQALEPVDELQKTVGCEAIARIMGGPVKEALLDAASKSGADAIIVGRGPRSGVFGRLRDLTYQLIRDAPVPVLSI